MKLFAAIHVFMWMLSISKIVANGVIHAEIREVTTESIHVVFNGLENMTSYGIKRWNYVDKHLFIVGNTYLHSNGNFLELEKNITLLDSNSLYRILVTIYRRPSEPVHAAPILIKTLPKASDVKATGVQIECVKNDSITIAWDYIDIADIAAEYFIAYNNKVSPMAIDKMTLSTDKSKVMFELTDLMKNTEYKMQVITRIERTNVESSTIIMRTLDEVTDIRNIGLEIFEDSCDLNWLATGANVTIKVGKDVYVTTKNYVTLWNLDRSKKVHKVEINSYTINVTLNKAKRQEIKFLKVIGASNDRLSIKWEVKRHASSYLLEWKVNDNNKFKSLMVSNNTASITDLQADTEYTIQVSTFFGYSTVRSKQVTIKTLPKAEDKIVNIMATVYTRSVSLVWSDRIPTGKTSYEISVEGDPTKTIITNKTYATIENIADDDAVQRFTVKAVSIDGNIPASDVSGSIQINMIEKSGESMYIPSFKLQYGGSNLILTWEGIKDIYNYTMKYINVNTTETKSYTITSFISKSYKNQYEHRAFEPQPDTFYKMVVETNDDNMKLRSRELIYHKDPVNIQVQIVNIFEDGIDIVWTDEEGLDVSEINIITEPKIADEFITINRKEANVWFVAGSTIKVSVNLISKSQNTNRTSEVIVVTLSKGKREIIDYLKITDVSEYGLQTYRKKNDSIYGHIEYIYYCENDENPKNVLKKKLLSSKNENREALVGLKNNTKYLVWFESYLFDTSLAKRSKVWTITTLTNPAAARITNLRVVNVYQKSFDVQWDEPSNPEEYELSVTPKAMIDHIKYWGRHASAFLNSSFDTSETEFEVSVHFKNNDTITSSLVKVTPGNEGHGLARPTLYAWIEKKTLNYLQVSWYGNGDSVVYTVNSTCHGYYRTSAQEYEYIGTSNTYTKYGLNQGTKCYFFVSARTLDGTSYFGMEPAEVRGVVFLTNDITEKLATTTKATPTTEKAAAGILSPSHAIPFVLTLLVLIKQLGLLL